MARNEFYLEASRTVEQAITAIEHQSDPLEAEGTALRLDYLARSLVNQEDSRTDEIVRLLCEVCAQLRTESRRLDASDNDGIEFAPRIHSQRRGRPAFHIGEEQLSSLLEEGFSVPIIARLFRVSTRTIERRMSKFGLSVSGTYSNISDHDLDIIVREAQQRHHGIGVRMLMGYLRGQHLRVQWERVRQAQLRTDASGVHRRWRQSIRRRVYHVSGPLALWHIDGNHKLIRWRIVVHGGIDGYSRIPVYLHASSNNKASTVLSLFTEAVAEFGLPSRVRSDKGGENYDVGWYMLNQPQRGPGRGSIIAGRSTHNQRIERLWRDLYAGCLCLFYEIFHYLEDNLLLDPTNEVHMWCLHYIYLPMINNHIKTWRDAWIHHPLRTAGNRTPMQLWISGLHFTQFGQRMLQTQPEPASQEEIDQYGIDWDAPVSAADENIVEVPHTDCLLDADSLTALQELIDPNTDDGNYGISLYNNTVAEVLRLCGI